MREKTFEKVERITNAKDEFGYPRGLYVTVEADGKKYTAYWDHRTTAGCVWLTEGDDEDDGGETFICRDAVLNASLCKFNQEASEWGRNCNIPVLTLEQARAFMALYGIPDDNWETFNHCLGMD